MKSVSKGFTLIELIVVIVILGILAATALPKFVDLSGDAKTAKAAAVAGAVASAANIQFAQNLVSGNGYTSVGACSFTHLQSGAPAGCSTNGANPCIVTCDAVAAPAVTLP